MATRKTAPAQAAPTKAATSTTVRATAKKSAGKPVDPAPPEVVKSKQKLVRDSFTIPKGEYAVLDELKRRALRLTRPAKKGEILRAGIAALRALPDTGFLKALDAVPSLKTGRPKDSQTAIKKA
jgi:hypothetical protein